MIESVTSGVERGQISAEAGPHRNARGAKVQVRNDEALANHCGRRPKLCRELA
jgi:hypothetical protein